MSHTPIHDSDAGDPREHARLEAGLIEQARALRAAHHPSLEPRILAAIAAREQRSVRERRWPPVLRAAALLLGLVAVGWTVRELAPDRPAPEKGPTGAAIAVAGAGRLPTFDVLALPRLLNTSAPETVLLGEVRGIERDSRAALRFLLARVRLGPGSPGSGGG